MSVVKANDIVGTRVGVLDILYECDFKANDGHKMYHVKCSECGWETDSKKSDIKKATKCTHIGICGNYIDFRSSWSNNRLARIFNKMKQRCYSTSDKDYRWYGEKGISICEEWLNNPKLFEEWSFANGYTDELTIDRKDESKNYCPENCRWVSSKDNAKYKSTTLLLDVDGEIHTGREWADVLNIGTNTINNYIRKYGQDKTKEFIRKYLKNPVMKPKSGQSYYDLYMQDVYKTNI